jgi:hypothetical protein
MSERALGKTPLHERAFSEFKEIAALAAYLYVCFGAIILFKAAVLQGAGVSFTIWGIAIVKALILAKFMLVGRMLKLGERYRDKPLIWPALHRSLMFLLLLLVLTTIEELVVGLIDGRSWADSLGHVVGPTFLQGLATSFIMFLILIPYSAFTCLGDVLGEREVFRLFFVDRSTDASVRDRLVTARVQTRT